jgi:nucleotide-binding universal stress UspA family protein
VAQGNFSDQCNAIAKKVDADCIVMGTKGASGVKEVLIGSNTADLMNNLAIPLYVVPKDFKEKSIKEMILSYDGSDIPIKVIPPILKFAKKHQLPLEFLHVRKNEENPIQDWSKIKSLFEGIKVNLHESWGINYEEGLKRGIEDREAILVMIKHKQTFWERFFNISDTRKVVMHAELPILVVPE